MLGDTQDGGQVRSGHNDTGGAPDGDTRPGGPNNVFTSGRLQSKRGTATRWGGPCSSTGTPGGEGGQGEACHEHGGAGLAGGYGE